MGEHVNAEQVMLDVLTVALGNKGGLDERAISQLLSSELLSDALANTHQPVVGTIVQLSIQLLFV